MKQRVGVAQAIIGSPSLLILDEPTNGLDPTQTEQMRQVIKNISETATVILSTHIMQEVEALCDRALIIRQGRLAVDAKLHDLTKSNRIALRSGSERQSIEQVLKQAAWFTGISQARHVGAELENREGLNEYILQIDDSHQLNDRISECALLLVEAGISIMGLGADNQNLQSLFVQVNSDQSMDKDGVGLAEEVEHVA